MISGYGVWWCMVSIRLKNKQPRQRVYPLTAVEDDKIIITDNMQTEKLIEGQYFHIFNRGINGEDIFKEERNYYYFLQQYQLYCNDVFETYAYTLLKNHFHLLVYVKEMVEVPRRDGKGIYKYDASKQLSHFFNSYSQSVNKAYNRTGPLFESPFERKPITSDQYLTSVIYYLHYNARLHGFVSDFKDWKFSSYHAIATGDCTWLATKKTIEWFGSIEQFQKAHSDAYAVDDSVKKFILE
jgi:putative transposase